jgi:hypothetical protein
MPNPTARGDIFYRIKYYAIEIASTLTFIIWLVRIIYREFML